MVSSTIANYSAGFTFLASGDFMNGYFTSSNENATAVTVPHTIFELRQSDQREIITACAGQDGAK